MSTIVRKDVVSWCLVCLTWSVGWAGVDCSIFWSDADLPLDIQQISDRIWQRQLMVGTRLVFVITSEQARIWEGGCLLVMDSKRAAGSLSARDYNDLTLDWAGSRYLEAGPRARVWRMAGWLGSCQVSGFQFMGSDRSSPGRWFCIDYQATSLGDCQVQFFDYSVSFLYPTKIFLFHHVPTKDLDADGLVCFKDFVLLAGLWRQYRLDAPLADLDRDGYIGLLDLAMFWAHWLDRSR